MSTVRDRPRVYIAAPYEGGGGGPGSDVALNVRSAMGWFDRLLGLDPPVHPVCPHWTHFQHLHAPRPRAVWLEHDLRELETCDAVLRVPAKCPAMGYEMRESAGADAEVGVAVSLGIPAFDELVSLCAWTHEWYRGRGAHSMPLTPIHMEDNA